VSRAAATVPILRPRHRPGSRVRPRAARPLPMATAPIAQLRTAGQPVEAPSPEPGEAPKSPRIWVAQYLYPGPGGEGRLAVRKIRAKDRESAEAVALRAAPWEEFVLTLVPESDDQFLGQVRHRALAAKARRS